MFKSKFCIAIVVLCLLSLISGACTQSPEQTIRITTLEVPGEGSPGEYIDVIIRVSSNQPYKLVLATPHKTEVDNYLSPHTTDKLTYPNSDGTVVFHEQIPWETAPGSYVLKVMQMEHQGDTEGTEILSKTFIVR